MVGTMRRFARFAGLGVLLVTVLSAFLVAYAYPVAAAVVCPGCYGMERVNDRLIVDRMMPSTMRRQLALDAEEVASRLCAFYGMLEGRPILVGCSTEECDRAMGGRGAYAVTISTPVATILRLSPRALNPTILAHELSHAELQRRIGMWAQLTGAFPAWFDEGVAVLVSSDDRYLRPGRTASQRCVRGRSGSLPADPFEWSAIAGSDHMIYADAACRVSIWMEANGGRDGVLRAIDAVAKGAVFDP